MGKPMGHVQGLCSQCKPNLDQKNGSCAFSIKIYFVKKKLENVVTITFYSSSIFLKNLHSLHYKGSSFMKVGNSFLLAEMHYNWTFSKMVHGWKRQHTSLGNFDFTLIIVSNLHDPCSTKIGKNT
jgi:hypothetical protein